MTNLSQWFDLAEQKPWEVGVYEVKYDGLDKIYYSWFNGEQFQSGWHSKQEAEENKNMPSGLWLVPEKWRGLSTNPEVKKVQNKRKTMYVVQALWASGLYKAEGSYKSHANAKKHLAWLESNKACDDAWIEKIRFRTPE